MARNGWIVVVAVLVVALIGAEAAERNGNAYCMEDCYSECMQIRIFNEGECKKDCSIACAKYAMKKALREEEDYAKFFPSWI